MTKVEADLNSHSVTVAFDDEATDVDALITALAKAGYAVPAYHQIEH